ncbi:hypothetical protein [uncultured Stenotrophomonas sp.]|uniref:hypothetical protein n=1 Tax=uncultured Stenotrophomonas sp. TaxID=165438 RepID=UPI0028E736C1|nr:hypothetical protein [uncultured Stenotrophomonas sp.]
MIPTTASGVGPLPPAADAPSGAVRLRGLPPRLPLKQVSNVEAIGPRPLDLARCPATPWQGAGSQPAVIVTRDHARWRVKATADTASSAIEVTLGTLFQLTGLLAPDHALVSAAEGLERTGQHVGTRYDPAFQDLGDFLLGDAAADAAAAGDPDARRCYDALRTWHAKALADNAALLRGAGVEWWALTGANARRHAATDQARFDALEAMNRMLPVPLRCEQLRHYVVSRWLGNWDQLNYRLENFGYTVREGAWVGMSLDFGSSGPLGFRHPESGAMLTKADSRTVAVVQRPPCLFPIPRASVANVAEFDAFGPDPGALHDLLTWPYGVQSESIAATFCPPVAPYPAVADTLAEMGYRLALLPHAAITRVIERHWPVETAGWPTPKAMAQRLAERRNALVARFDPAQVRDWIKADPERANGVRKSIADALTAALGPIAAAPGHAVLEQVHATLSRSD